MTNDMEIIATRVEDRDSSPHDVRQMNEGSMPQWKILLVDDNPDDRAVCRRRLLHDPYAKYILEEADSASVGLAACATFQPDCILLDSRLPDLDGVQFLTRLTAQMGVQRPAVVMLTGTGSETLIVEAMQHGAQDYLDKGTFTTETLARAIANAIDKSMLRRTLEAQRRALAESEERFRVIANYTYDWESWIGPDGRPLWINPAVERLTGWSVSECLAMPEYPLFLIHEDDRAQMAEQFHAALSGASANDVEFRLMTKTGNIVWVAGSWQPIHSQGCGRGYRSSMRDITARKEGEAAQLRLAAIVESSEDAIISKSLDGVMRSWNAAAERLFGYRAEEMIGHSIRRLLPADRYDEEDMILARLRRGEHVEHFETVRRTKDGRLVEVSVTISPLRNTRGIIIGASKIVRDITARKEIETALALQAAELQRINTELQQFAYIVSHDLGEPLRTMRSYVQLLEREMEGKLETDAKEYMDFVTDAAQRLQQMLADLLAYTHAGQTPEFQPVDCEALLTQVLSSLDVHITERGAQITHDPLPTVRGDATRLRQVLQNLISNALKFCEAQPPCIHIAAVNEHRHYMFSVRDNGIGIDLQQNGRLFQVFQRLHTRSEYPGSGIGLAICKRIVEQHGGRIWVESQPRQGSVFYFTISKNKNM